MTNYFGWRQAICLPRRFSVTTSPCKYYLLFINKLTYYAKSSKLPCLKNLRISNHFLTIFETFFFVAEFWPSWVKLWYVRFVFIFFLCSSRATLFVNVNLNRSFEGITHVICSVCKSTGVANEWAETKEERKKWVDHCINGRPSLEHNSSSLNYLASTLLLGLWLCVTFHR